MALGAGGKTMQEVTVGIAGAAGDGLDKSGDTLAKTAGRLGLHVYAYNSYQSIIRGGHIWLKVRIGENKVFSHGDNLGVLVALNQDSIERHAYEVDEGGCVVFNSDKIKCDPAQVKPNVEILGLPMAEITKEIVATHGAILPIMQNTVAIGAVLFLSQIDFAEGESVITETFQHKGDKVVQLNVSLLKAGYEYAKVHSRPIMKDWNYSKIRRPFVTGNEAIAIAAAASGCKFYSAYPMTPASTILHWMANHAEAAGICVKQAEDELAVINMAVGAGIAGVRSMCATAGGGFALMTEAIGMAGIMETPVVCVEVQRGGPSTGLPTKTEQADLNQVFGASQGEYPRMIVAPRDTADCFNTTVEAFNVAEKYQMPVLLMSDLLLSEHPETADVEVFKHDVKIDRGETVTSWPETNGKYKRFALTESGISPRAIPGTENTLYVSGSDEHDERGILISDMFTVAPVRRKMFEKRMKKLDLLLKELPAPQIEGDPKADLTLVGWGSTYGAIREAAELLCKAGIKTNYLIIKYLYPFHGKEVSAILSKCKKKISVEANFTSQLARYIRSETGLAMDGYVTKYDGEPFEPAFIMQSVKDILGNKVRNLDVTEQEAKEIAYHYLRTNYKESLRPERIVKEGKNGHNEATWKVELVERATKKKQAELSVGIETGATYEFVPTAE